LVQLHDGDFPLMKLAILLSVYFLSQELSFRLQILIQYFQMSVFKYLAQSLELNLLIYYYFIIGGTFYVDGTFNGVYLTSIILHTLYHFL